MLFRRRSRSRDSPMVQIVGDCSVQLSPTTAKKTGTRHTLEETYVFSAKQPTMPHQRGGSSDESCRSSNSSPDRSPVYQQESASKRTPTSRKTGFATIRTDSTDTQPAFESDAFAVLMPTTRLPILDRPSSSTKEASPAARAAAFKTYQEKAQQIRERNNSQGVKVPSKIVSYDYASRHLANHRTSPEVEVVSPTPAGSFPISPPLPQYGWANPERATGVQKLASRHVHGLSNVSTLQKPTAATTSTKPTSPVSPVSPISSYRVYRADATAGASHSTNSPSSLPASITVRVKSKPVVSVPERVQTENKRNLYHRPSASSSSQNSISTTPVKSMPNFTRHNSVEGDSLFGYKSKDVNGTIAGASPTSSGSEKGKEKEVFKCRVTGKVAGKEKELAKTKAVENATKTTPKRSLTTRWPWLRPSGPRIAKPTTSPVIFTVPAPAAAPVSKPAPRPLSGYVDPFATHDTPTPAPTPTPLRNATPRLISPRKTPTRPTVTTPTPPASTGKFDTGFAQIKSLTLMLLKFCFILYSVIALWFILDALREAIHTIGVPFRLVGLVGGVAWTWVSWMCSVAWMWVSWACGVLGAVFLKRR
jgi:hypothetical protein